jgi:hypothetical protein
MTSRRIRGPRSLASNNSTSDYALSAAQSMLLLATIRVFPASASMVNSGC